ncbi:MAG TPA: 5-oxoprolinase subunit PxpB [Rhodanobacteraceae bacterium]|nr:5-oxoprolinase subunit PxpB [Rhodanobacteraceae bacterium]
MADCAIEALAEDALLLRFGDGIDVATNARVHAAARALRNAGLPGITDIAPAYAALLLRFDPWAWWDKNGTGKLPHERLAEILDDLLRAANTKSLGPGLRRDDEQKTGSSPDAIARTVEIPVCYGGEYGLDLDAVAEHAGLSRDDVIARHTSAEYTVAMLGFAPGFPYLLGLDPSLQMPRRADPRTRVPAGSIAIGGAQTGIYPRELPGGWHLIGRTPLALFDPAREPPCLLAPGDHVQFRAIEADEFEHLAERDA